MSRDADTSAQAAAEAGRIVAFDRARTFTTLLVVIHHSVVNFTQFGNGDRMRWLGFDLIVLFNDSFFMAFMFLISGLFVHDSLTRNGAGGFLRRRAWRLGIPLLVSIFVLIPTAGNLVRVLSSKQSIIDGRVEKLERKQARALEPPKPSKSSKSSDSSSGSSGAILREHQDKNDGA